MHTIFLALGANIGNRKQQIKDAVILLQEQVENISVAKLYETKPMYHEKQKNFLNTVLRGQTTLSPEALLLFVKKIEKQIGRVKRFRNGPREIDIDILFYDDLIFTNKELEIPHPRIQERNFVIEPLMDLDPNLIHPILKKTVRELHSLLDS